LRAKSVANLRSVEGNSHHTERNVSVIGDVGELLEAWDFSPKLSVEHLRNLICHTPRITT
jgi:hypothetical protein